MMRKDFVIPCRVAPVTVTLGADGASVERPASECDAVVLFVTGEEVGRKRYDASDPVVRRIESNSGLYVSRHDGGFMDYVRKAPVDDVAARDAGLVLGVVVCRDLESVDRDMELRAVCRGRLSLSALRRNPELIAALASGLFKRMLLPVLLVYLAVLLVNFFVHSSLVERIGELRSASARETVAAKKRSEVTRAQERLFAGFMAVPDIDISGISDAVASVVPGDIRLTSLSFNDPKARKTYSVSQGRSIVMIAGEAFSSETVLSFVERLRDSVGCEALNILRLERDDREDVFRFEIQMLP